MSLLKASAATAAVAALLFGLVGGATARASESSDTSSRTVEAMSDAERAQRYSAAANLSQEQIGNARLIIGVGYGHKISEQGIKVALIAAMQESSLRNLNYGDKDSLGLFQQRPSMGWGTPAQIMDPVISTQSFYGVADHGRNPGLMQIRGWQNMRPEQAAQAVQRSAYPNAYAKWVPLMNDVYAQQAGSVQPIPHKPS